MYIEYFHGNCLRFDWIYKPWAKSWFSWEAERGLRVTAWQCSHGGAAVLGMGPGRAVDAMGASQGIWELQSFAPIARGARWGRALTRYVCNILHCVFLWAEPVCVWGYSSVVRGYLNDWTLKGLLESFVLFSLTVPISFTLHVSTNTHQCFSSFLIRMAINAA